MPRKIFTADQLWVRKLNRATLLKVLLAHRTLSRAGLADQTGLNPSTVSNIVTELISVGLLRECELDRVGVGRPGRLLELNPRGGSAIGMEVNVDYLAIILTDVDARKLWSKKVDLDPDESQANILNLTVALIEEALHQSELEGLKPWGIGLGIAGPVDVVRGDIRLGPNLKWHEVPIRAMLEDRFHLPVYVENDAKAAALGEYYFGVANNVENFIFLSSGIGLGGGIICDGQLFRGSRGFAGEIGHMTIDPGGDVCGCGKRGCWETLVGPRAVVRRVRQLQKTGSPSMILEMAGGRLDQITFSDIVSAADAGDPIAIKSLQDVGENLGIGAVNIMNAFDTELIVLGGTLNLASRYLLPIIDKALRDNSLAPLRDHVRVSASALGIDACVMGAVAMVVDGILRGAVG